MRIGVVIGVTTVPWDLFGQVEQVVRAEADGFDSCWFTHIAGADALTVLALAGPRTQRIELGAAVVPIYPRHPTALAQQALTANAAAGGRLALGIGPAHRPAVERLGLRYEGVARYVREYLAVLRPLVHDGSVDVAGDALTARSVTLRVPDARPFPILVAALAPRMLRLAGELADGTLTWMVGPRTCAGHIAPRIRRAAAAAGRPPPRLALGAPVAVCGDERAGRAQADRTFAGYGRLPNYRRTLDLEGAAGPGGVAICGPEAHVERQLRDYASLGASDLLAAIYPVGEDAAGSVARTRAFLTNLVGRI
jgi:5,10-methylenetetrahydromethanopterin reductase